MSFLAGRLASTEGAYFRQESKQAVSRLAQKLPPSSSNALKQSEATEADKADVLHEILRHSLPPGASSQPADSSLAKASKWVLSPRTNSSLRASPDVLNPLRAFASLPQVTFGPKRWELPRVEGSLSASTANELRRDRYPPLDPKKLKAAAEGLSQIGKAFAVATTIVFGGATLVFMVAASKLQLQSMDDIKTKGRDLLQPHFQMTRDHLIPLRNWAEGVSQKWRPESTKEAKGKPAIVEEIKKILGPANN